MLSAVFPPNVPELRNILVLFEKFPVLKYCDIIRKVCWKCAIAEEKPMIPKIYITTYANIFELLWLILYSL